MKSRGCHRGIVAREVLACAAFFMRRNGLLRIGSETNEPNRLGVRE
jgi:hypothetical protein